MKRVIQALVALTLLAAVPLAGCGLTQAAGGVLVGGGGLTLSLLMALTLVGSRAARPARAAAATAATTAAAATATTTATATATTTATATATTTAAAAPATTTAAAATAKAPGAPAATYARPTIEVVESVPRSAHVSEIEKVTAFFVAAAAEEAAAAAPAAEEGFGADELAFFAVGENPQELERRDAGLV